MAVYTVGITRSGVEADSEAEAREIFVESLEDAMHYWPWDEFVWVEEEDE